MSDSTGTGQPATEATQQTGSASSQRTYHFAARGFWLPCDQTSFFGHDKDKRFREPLQIADDPILNKEALAKNLLEDHVLHRLALVLSRKEYGYTDLIPAYHASVPFGEDPDAAVFVHRKFSAPDISFKREDDAYDMCHLDANLLTVEGIALLVNSSGFYLWIMRYSLDTHLSAEKRKEAQKQAEDYLETYVYWIVGGNFASRYSGWNDEADLATKYERENTLQDYERHFSGILTFAQINIIFEGLFSSALDFHVFFLDTASTEHKKVNNLRRQYSLGRFVSLISTPLTWHKYEERTQHLDTETPTSGHPETTETMAPMDEDIVAFLTDLDLLHPKSLVKVKREKGQGYKRDNLQERAKHVAHDLCFDYLGEVGCGVLLLKFLQTTAQRTLLYTKRRIERSRRALVAEILQVTQRQDPLLQVEVPPHAHKGKKEGAVTNPKEPYSTVVTPPTGSGDEELEAERIAEVNESQLRGYVLLISAKLPLISNVRVYLDEIAIANNWYRRSIGAATSQPTYPRTTEEREVTASLAVWRTLLSSIEKELVGLEHAIAQERQDRMVQEEEKIRVEQETLAEIERLQDRNSKSLSPRATFTLAFVSNVFAIASVLVAVFGTGITVPTQPVPTDFASLITLIAVILMLALALSALYFLAQYLFFTVGSAALLLLRIPLGNRYYYEMDIHVDAPIDSKSSVVTDLISGEFKKSGRGERLIEGVRQKTGKDWKPYRDDRVLEGVRFWTRLVWPAFRHTERNSYRVERSGRNEGMHKVYLEVTALLARRHWYQILHPSVHLVLVYEIFFHRPGGEDRYILNDIRVVSTQGRILDAKQLAHIKRIVADYFVNPLIAQQSRGTWEILPTDALMATTSPQPETDSRWRGKARRWARGPFNVLMQLGVASAFLFLLRGLLDVVAMAAGGGLKALSGAGAIAKAMYFSETWTFLRSISWEWLVFLVIVPTVIALVLGVFPTLRIRVRKTVIETLDPPKPVAPGSESPKSSPLARLIAFVKSLPAFVKRKLRKGASARNNQKGTRQEDSASRTGPARRLSEKMVLALWFVGGWFGYRLQQIVAIGKLVVLWALASASVVAFLSMIVALLAQHGRQLLFLFP